MEKVPPGAPPGKTVEQMIADQDWPFDEETDRQVAEWEAAIGVPPPPPQNASYYESDVSGQFEWPPHWFWRYCLPFVGGAVIVALILMMIQGIV